MSDELYRLVAPAVTASGLELVDVELRSGILTVTVDGPDGVDLDALTRANRAVSTVLDEADPIPGRYSLEVSSPGVERTLRRPDHFRRAIGEVVAVKTRPQVPGERRVRGVLTSADDDGFTVRTGDGHDGELRLAYGDVDRVRTVFEWGPAPKPGRAGPRAAAPARTTHERKQVTTP